MKLPLLSLCFVSMVVGCASSLPPPPPVAPELPLPQKEVFATLDDCTQVYGTILGIQLVMLTEGAKLTDEEIDRGIESLDAYNKSKGRVTKLFEECVGKFTKAQLTCLTHMTSLEGMRDCMLVR